MALQLASLRQGPWHRTPSSLTLRHLLSHPVSSSRVALGWPFPSVRGCLSPGQLIADRETITPRIAGQVKPPLKRRQKAPWASRGAERSTRENCTRPREDRQHTPNRHQGAQDRMRYPLPRPVFAGFFAACVPIGGTIQPWPAPRGRERHARYRAQAPPWGVFGGWLWSRVSSRD